MHRGLCARIAKSSTGQFQRYNYIQTGFDFISKWQMIYFSLDQFSLTNYSRLSLQGIWSLSRHTAGSLK